MKKVVSCTAVAVALLLASVSALAGPVNINKADAATLAAELNGVGPALAKAIVKDRKMHGKFKSPEDLERVKGVGQHIILANKGDILVSSPAVEGAPVKK